ncbi:methyltransferase type 11 [Mycobacterium seoulense]|uniref:methyltransferase type 11 n=1 Tax=Mycobacterium seoulense TaxID=386911 RepID=UPI003CF2DC16
MTTTPPVIFVIFNRPDSTRRVFETIRAARPSTLLVVADGPRADVPGEAEKCAAARAVIEGVDWDCDVQTNYSETNLGCRLRCSSGITWAFELVDRAIIIEDDCIPSASFFPYCAELLERYESDERVMMVSGDNHLFGRAETAESYYFSRFAHLWGWATWRRAWARYDIHMTNWPEIRDRGLFDHYFRRPSERFFWESVLQCAYDGNVDTWDFQWVYSIWANSALCVAPARNLVRNIGFHPGATHTMKNTAYSSLSAEELDLPLTHPATVLASYDKDELEAKVRAGHDKGLPYPLNKYAASAYRLLARKPAGHGRNR